MVSLVGIALLFGLLVGCSGRQPAAARSPSPSRHRVISKSTANSPGQSGARRPIYHGTLAHYTLLFVACMRSEGWQAVADPDLEGWGITGLPASEDAAEQRAVGKCNDKVGSIPPPPTHPSRALVLSQYRWQLKTRECLVELGLPITVPPSFDRYFSSYATGSWSAYDVISPGYTYPSSQNFDKVNRECPQGPARIYDHNRRVGLNSQTCSGYLHNSM